MRTKTKMTFSILVIILIACTTSIAQAVIPEPPNVVYGKFKYIGANVPQNAVISVVVDGIEVAEYKRADHLDDEDTQSYVIHIPLDSGSPADETKTQVGDIAYLYLSDDIYFTDEPVGDVVIDVRGTLHEIDIMESLYGSPDISGNGIVDIDDLTILAQYWLTDNTSADIAPYVRDGIVDMQDFAVLASQWLPETEFATTSTLLAKALSVAADGSDDSGQTLVVNDKVISLEDFLLLLEQNGWDSLSSYPFTYVRLADGTLLTLGQLPEYIDQLYSDIVDEDAGIAIFTSGLAKAGTEVVDPNIIISTSVLSVIANDESANSDSDSTLAKSSVVETLEVKALSETSSEAEGNYWEGSDDGTAEKPYQIWTAAQLDQMHYRSEDWDKCFILMDNIDMSDYEYNMALIAFDKDEATGSQGKYFTGEFKGNGKNIEGLIVIAEMTSDDIGLFGRIGSDGKIENLKLIECQLAGDRYVGSLVGYNEGTISNCYLSGHISGNDYVGGLVGVNHGYITNCCLGDVILVEGYNDYIGGLTGSNTGVITNCCYIGQVAGDDSVGGLVGKNSLRGNIINSYSSGFVSGDYTVGGIVAHNYGNIANCYSASEVMGTGYVGGFIGENHIGGNINSCFWDVDKSKIGVSGDDNYGATGKTSIEMQMFQTFINAGWDLIGEKYNGTSEVWQIPTSGGSPVLSSMNGYLPIVLEGEGSRDNPYLISDPNELGAVYYYNPDSCYKLICNIDLNGIQWTTCVIPLLKGYFDGENYAINNLDIYGGGQGLWCTVGGDACVVNLKMKNSIITSSVDYVGGLASYNDGSIFNCSSSGIVSGNKTVGGLVGNNDGSISNCSSSGIVSGNDNVGGLVGYNDGSISLCSSFNKITGNNIRSLGGLVGYNDGIVSNCYSTDSVTCIQSNSYAYIGGLIGINYGSISNCYSTDSVACNQSNYYAYVGGLVGYNDGIISNCYSTGPVSCDQVNREYLDACVGGLVGYNCNNISNCFSTGPVTCDYVIQSPYICVGGFVGLNGGNIYTCFWDSQNSQNDIAYNASSYSNYEKVITPVYNLDGVVEGKTTIQMQEKETYTSAGWDFVGEIINGIHDVWQMPPSSGYPVLRNSLGYNPIYLNGEGSQSCPFLISNALELVAINFYNSDACYRLTNDINLAGFQWDKAVITSFNGYLDGGSFSIDNIEIDGSGYLGLFGTLGLSAKVSDLGIKNVSVTGTGNYVGGLAGINSGIITHCYMLGSVIGGDITAGGLVGCNDDGSISNCYAVGVNIEGSGLVGRNKGFITDCYSIGMMVSGGGLVGSNGGVITRCFAAGTVVGGGLVDFNEDAGCLINCYSTSVVLGNEFAGGLVKSYGSNYISRQNITNCYSAGRVKGNEYVGGFMASLWGCYGEVVNCYWDRQNSGNNVAYFIKSGTYNNYVYTPVYSTVGIIEGKLTTEMRQRSNYVDWDFDGTWGIREGMSYPHLNFIEGQGTPENPFRLYSPGDLIAIGFQNYYWDKHFKLMNDLDLSGVELTPIGNNEEIQVGTTTVTNSFSGTFDGNRHVIRNFKVSHKDSVGTKLNDVGLFGLVSGQGAQIKQLGIEAVTIGLPDDRAGNNVGGLVGRLSGGAKVSECFVTDDSGAVRIFGTDNVGGLVGFVSDSGTVVENCYTLFNHSGTSEEQTRISSNNVTGNNATGGLAGGLSGGALRNCYSDAYIATVLSGVSKGFIAGCVADDTGSQIELCYYDADREDEDSSINNNGESCDLGDIDGYYIYEDEEATVWDFVSNDDRYEELLLPLGLSDDGNYDLWYMYDNGSKKFPKFWWQHPERSDVNCDNKVDIDDLFIIAEEWLTKVPVEGGRLLSDINKEDGVNLTDFSQLACKWLIDLK